MPLKKLVQKIRVAIADDHGTLRQALVFILSRNPGIQVVAECANGQEAIQAAKEHLPDVVLMDINMHPMNGIQATEEIAKHCPSTKVVAMSVHSDMSYVNRMLKVGAKGYVTKNSSTEEMIEAIKHASRGERYLCREIKEASDLRR